MTPDHWPKRGDGVEAWLKRCRGAWPKDSQEYWIIGSLLFKYQDCADLALRLGPENEPTRQ